jgi:alpha-glucosidase
MKNPLSMASAPVFSVTNQDGARITLLSADGCVVHIFVLEEDILRVMVLPQGNLRFPRTWAIAPGLEDVPLEGRDRFSLESFALPSAEISQDADQLLVATARVRLKVKLHGLFCEWEILQDGNWQLAASDRSPKVIISVGGISAFIIT